MDLKNCINDIESELERLSEELMSIPMGVMTNLKVGNRLITVDCRRFPPIISVDGKEQESALEKLQNPKDFLRSIT
jgi:hypothetical protein